VPSAIMKSLEIVRWSIPGSTTGGVNARCSRTAESRPSALRQAAGQRGVHLRRPARSATVPYRVCPFVAISALRRSRYLRLRRHSEHQALARFFFGGAGAFDLVGHSG